MSDHFKRFLKLLGIGLIILSGLFVWLKHRLTKGGALTFFAPRAVLPLNDKEVVIFNEKTHKLTVMTAAKTITEYAKNPEVQLRKNGDVVINRHLFGFENNFYLGIGYADSLRVFVGDNLLHFGRIDISPAMGITTNNDKVLLKPTLNLGYNFYSNTSLNFGLNPLSFTYPYTPDIIVFVSVKL